MRDLRKIAAFLLCISCLLVMNGNGITASATESTVDVYIDGAGGTFKNGNGYDMFNEGTWVAAGSTLAASGFTMEDPIGVGMQFLGWMVCDGSGAQLEGRLLTTSEALNYIVPNHSIRLVAQWEALDGGPVTAITYAALYNGTGQPDYNVRVTLVNNGICYSGYGYVTISEAIYSTWTGEVEHIWELPGEYVAANRGWTADYFRAVGTVKSFIKEGSCYVSVSKTGNEKEVPAEQAVVNDFYYSVRNAQPEIYRRVTDTDTTIVDDNAVVPAGYMVETKRHESGSAYNNAFAIVQGALGTSNMLVYDIELKDADGAAIHQLGDTVEVRINIPEEYVIQPENTVVVYYLADDGTLEECETTYYGEDPVNRYLTFKTDHFSVYVVAEVPVVVETEPETTEPETMVETTAESGSEEDVSQSTQEDVAETTPATEESTPAGSEQDLNEDQGSMGWMGIALGVVVIAAVAVVFLRKRK